MDSSNKRLKSASGAPISTSPAANLTAYQPPAALPTAGALRPSSSRPTASITRGANGSSLKLKVHAPSSKLKQVTGAGEATLPPNPYADLSESDATPQPAVRSARQTRNPRTVIEPDTDEDEDEDEDMEDAEGDEQNGDDMDEEDDATGDSEDDAEGEDDEDELASDPPPPPPIIRQERPTGSSKPNVTVTAPPSGPLKSVEAKEMDLASDEDEELSELDSNADALGDEEEDDEGEGDDDDDSDPDNSRSATPDLTKLTQRQRAARVGETEAGLMELSNEALKKKHLTDEEQIMRRTEMARRRKNLSEKRNEEEKMDTINKLLKKPAPKRRTRAEIIAQQQADLLATPGAEDGEEGAAVDPVFVRWVNNARGSRVGVPGEWMEGAVGEVFRGSGKMVEEVA